MRSKVRTFVGRIRHGELGMATAEYAIGTIAAASFAALLIKLLTSSSVQAMLMKVIKAALSLGS